MENKELKEDELDELREFAKKEFERLIKKNDPSVMPILNKLFEKTFGISLNGENYTEVFLTGDGCSFGHSSGKLEYKK